MLPIYRQVLDQPSFTSSDNSVRPGRVSLNDAIQRSQHFLLSFQNPEGYWWGETESSISSTAQALLLFKIWGVDQRLPLHKIEAYLLANQRHHGGWELFYDDGGDLSTTVEAYLALRLLNFPTSNSALERAKKFILARGGISKTRVFTKLHLAVIGCFNWYGVPSIPMWIVLLPDWFPSTIYDMSAWARVCVVPLTIVFDSKPVFAIDHLISLDELFVERNENDRYDLPQHHPWTGWFTALDRVIKWLEKYDLVPFKERALKRAEQWILERQEVTGEQGGITPAMYYSLLAMRVLGYSNSDPAVERAFQGIRLYTMETEQHFSVQCSISPTWDTALTVRALAHSGLSGNHPSLQRAGEWLLQKQILNHYGDWKVRCKRCRPGGWAFQFNNQWYPDVDDTALVVMALNEIELPNELVKQEAIARAVEWIVAMQCEAGGWGAFDANNNQEWLNTIPFGDSKAMIDPNTVDITARVLEMEGRIRKTSQHAAGLLPRQAIDRALAYLRKEQESEGCWFGRWGVNYIYGTCGALEGMALLAAKEHEQEIARGARWLVECQREDGGWGETCSSYVNPSLKGKSNLSTISQTSWALMGLLAAGKALNTYETEALERGVQYLLENQRSDGSWYERGFTGTGFPGHFYFKFHSYALYFPLTALSRYRDLVTSAVVQLKTFDLQT